MSRRVPLLRTYVSKERIISIIKVTKIGELETTLPVTSNQSTLPFVLYSVLLPPLSIGLGPCSSNI
jgi:hypothetical protein